MFLLDSLLIGGLRFVFDKVAAAVDRELNDDAALREELLAAQMRVELGEMNPQEFESLEADILAVSDVPRSLPGAPPIWRFASRTRCGHTGPCSASTPAQSTVCSIPSRAARPSMPLMTGA